MLTMDVFRGDAFSAISLTAAVDKLGHVPGVLSRMPGLFVPQPVATEVIMIEERDNAPALIQTTPRGAPPKATGSERRKMRSFNTVRLADSSRISASALQGVRAFGSETELQTLQSEVARRMLLINNKIDLTFENMLLGMVQGLVTDADGSTIYNWATEFSQSIPAEVDFDLDNASPLRGALRKACATAVRSITRALKGLGGANVQVVGLCGDAFFDDLVAHPEVYQTYIYQEGAKLREATAWREVLFGGVLFVNYRGTDDGTTVAVGTDKCKFFPLNAGIFQVAYSPGESFEFANTMGRERYAMMVIDKDRDMWADIEIYSYPLPVCVQPSALYQARRT